MRAGLRRYAPRAAAGAAVIAVLLLVSPAGSANNTPTKPENPTYGPPPHAHRAVYPSDQLQLTSKRLARPAAATAPAGTAAAAAASGYAPFMTRPYWNQHSVTSIFDHCNPDYSIDGRICDGDGNVATSSNGRDPSFPSGYAYTPGGGDYVYYDGHNGWDLGLSYETLLAAAPGTVSLAGTDPYNPGFGLTVTINHPNGLTTRYAHMSQIWVSSGQQVARGQQIGVSGNTGNSSGPHLHFGLYITSSWTVVDPWGWDGAGTDPWPYDIGDMWLTGNPQNPVPTPPNGVTATAGDGTATVSWTPGFDGGEAISSYVITASPGGAQVSVPGGQTSATFPGLSNFTAYSFTVHAVNSEGTSGESAASAAVTPIPRGPSRTVAVAPFRLVDTRTGQGGITTLQPGSTVTFPVAGQGSIPGSAVGVVANLTAVNATAGGYLTIFPSGSPQPATSTLNYGPGGQVANLAQAYVGSDGRLAVYNGSTGTVDLAVDAVGWLASGGATGPDGHYRSLTPARMLDTRNAGSANGAHRLGPGQALNLQLAGRGGVPATGAGAVVLNLTATNASDYSYLSAWPAGSPPAAPTSNVNFGPGQTVANRVLVPLGAGGAITIFNSAGGVDVVVDVNGWLTDGSSSSTTSSGGVYTAVRAARIIDTRDGTGGYAQPVAGGSWISFAVAGLPGLPAGGVTAVAVNLATTNGSMPSYLSVTPSSAAAPSTSDLNFVAGQTLANVVIAPVGPDGRVYIYNANGLADVVVDLAGWYS